MANRKLSPLMILVLDVCQDVGPDEAVSTEELVNRFMQQNDRDLNSAKASISRALRRMWRRGLVELYDTDQSGDLMPATEAHNDGLERLEAAEENPERYLTIARNASPSGVPWRTAGAMLKDYRRYYGAGFPSGFRVRYVSVVPRA